MLYRIGFIDVLSKKDKIGREEMMNIYSNTNILFIGGAFLEENSEYINNNSKGAVQNAANQLQWNYIEGIEQNLNLKVDILNAVFVGTFPKYFKKAIVKGNGRYVEQRGREIFDVSFFNLPYLVEISKTHEMKKALKRWILTHDGSHIVIAYGFFEHNIKLLSLAKDIDNNCVTCLIIPDLPQYMSLNQSHSFIRKKTIAHISTVFDNNRKAIDYYSVVTKQMAQYLNLEDEHYTVVDGMYTTDKLRSTRNNVEETSNFSFLYTGGLSDSYGTDVLINGFMNMKNKNTELWLCGDGPYVKELNSICKREHRILYLGVMPRNECVKLQHTASCLINPRMDSEITKYSFPSKTMEYLATGKPVIAKRLEGMDKEYSDFFYQFDAPQQLSEVMDYVSKTDYHELHIKGEKGKEFVKNKKNNIYQTSKLIGLMSINDEDKI